MYDLSTKCERSPFVMNLPCAPGTTLRITSAKPESTCIKRDDRIIGRSAQPEGEMHGVVVMRPCCW